MTTRTEPRVCPNDLDFIVSKTVVRDECCDPLDKGYEEEEAELVFQAARLNPAQWGVATVSVTHPDAPGISGRSFLHMCDYEDENLLWDIWGKDLTREAIDNFTVELTKHLSRVDRDHPLTRRWF